MSLLSVLPPFRRLLPAILAAASVASPAADTVRPTVKITKPSANQQVNAAQGTAPLTAQFTAQGTAADNTGVAQVYVQFNSAGFQAVANGAGQWSYTSLVTAGTNVISAYAVDIAGNYSITSSVRMFYAVKAPLWLDTSPQNAGSVSGVANNQQLFLGRAYTATATPRSGYVFARWIGPDFTSTTPRLTFLMTSGLQLEAAFALNPFKPLAGTYSGIFQPEPLPPEEGSVADPGTPAALNSGMLTFSVSSLGAVSGRLVMPGYTWPFSGQFDYRGEFATTIKRSAAQGNMQLQLNLAPEGRTNFAVGRVSGTGFVSTAVAARQTGKGYAGRFTFGLQGVTGSDAYYAPAGFGSGTVTISSAGAASVAGTLADGTAFTGSATVSHLGTFPLYNGLYSGRGLLLGLVTVETNTRPAGLFAQVRWIKPTLVNTPVYPVGFNTAARLLGATYQPPPAGGSPVDWTVNVSRLNDGLLPVPITNLVAASGSKITAPGATNGLQFTVTPSSGLFSGKFVHPLIGRLANFKGALVQLPESQGGTRGVGAFPASILTGAVLIGPEIPFVDGLELPFIEEQPEEVPPLGIALGSPDLPGGPPDRVWPIPLGPLILPPFEERPQEPLPPGIVIVGPGLPESPPARPSPPLGGGPQWPPR